MTILQEKLIDEMQKEVDNLHSENALKLKQILDLEDKVKEQSEFIKFLVREIWNDVTDGDMPDIEKIKEELIKLGIDPDNIMVY